MASTALISRLNSLIPMAAFAAFATLAAPAGAAHTARHAAEQARAECARQSTAQDRQTCMKEAAAAAAEARRGGLTPAADARSVAQERCRPLPAADRDACMRMALGEGKVSGSVDGGGVLKEVVTLESPASQPAR